QRRRGRPAAPAAGGRDREPERGGGAAPAGGGGPVVISSVVARRAGIPYREQGECKWCASGPPVHPNVRLGELWQESIHPNARLGEWAPHSAPAGPGPGGRPPTPRRGQT